MDLLKDFLRVTLSVPIVWLVFILPTILHETGHMIGYLLCAEKRVVNWHIEAGSGKQLMRIGSLIIRLVPWGGSFRLAESTLVSKKTALATLAGGPTASLLMSIALLVIYRFVLADELIAFMFYGSFFQFLFTIIPLRYPAWLSAISESDGLQILRLMKKSK